MSYTPAKFDDSPIEGIDRISEEEFQRIEVLASQARTLKKTYDEVVYAIREARKDILKSHGKQSVESFTSDGSAASGWVIFGHNICKVIY